MTNTLWKTLGAVLTTLTLLGGLTACGGGGSNTDNSGAATAATTDTSTPASAYTVPRFAYVANSASDTVSIYRVDASTGQWHPNGYAVTGRRPSSVTVDPSGQFAYVTNFYGNSVSAYAINASNGALTKVGEDVPTGATPSAITIDAQHHFAYLSTGQGIAIYAIDAGTGALNKVGADVPTGEGPSQLVIDPSRQLAYVSVRTTETLLAYAIDAQSGTLTQTSNATTLSQIGAFRISPGGTLIYALTNYDAVATFSIDAQNGALTTEGDSVTAGDEVVAITSTPSGKFVYVANKSAGTVSAFAVASATGALTKIGDVATGKQPVAVTVDAGGHFAYVANGGDHTVSAYSIDANTGKLTSVGLVRAQLEPSAIAILSGQAAVSVTPQFVYASNLGTNTISAFSVDARSGALKKISDFTAEASPSIVAVDPYGRFVYVVSEAAHNISTYAIDSAGNLHKVGSVSPDDAGLQTLKPSSLVVDPSGRFVYASYASTDLIQAYTIDASTGNLHGAGVVGTTFSYDGLAIDPTGRFVYAKSNASNVISIWRIDATTGSLTPVDDFVTAASPQAMACDPSGQYAYVAFGGLDVVIQPFAIDATSGKLVATPSSMLLPASVPSTGLRPRKWSALSLNIDPAGRFAYAAASEESYNVNNMVSAYAIGASGSLTKVGDVSSGTLPTSDVPGSMAIDPSGRFVYVANFKSTQSTVSAFSISTNSGALTKIGDFDAGGGPTSVVVAGVMR